MAITFEIPPDIERRLRAEGTDLDRKAREAFLVELFRNREISHRQLGEALGLEAYETDGVLKAYNVGLDVSIEELREEALSLRSASPRSAAPR